MGLFRNTYGVIFITIKVSLLLVLLYLKSVKSDDNETIVRKLCAQSLEPNPCLNCILSDKSRASSNVTDMTYSILFCMYSQATYAHECADQFYQNTAAVMLKKAFEVCKDSMFSASNTLWDGINKMEVYDYENAYASATTARSDLNQCVFGFRSFSDVVIPSELLGYMVQAKHLFDVADFMFRLII